MPPFVRNFRSSIRAFVLATIAFFLMSALVTGFTITDGQLGSWYFHNARVILTFVGDTKNVHSNVPFPPTDITANLNIQGRAEITIVGDDKSVHATFDDPNQKIFISDDLTNDGIGFGLCSPNCLGLLSAPPVLPSVFQPVYPFGISQFDGFTGRSFSCIDFGMPDSAYSSLCPDPNPNVPLKTDKGDLYLYQTYQEENWAGEFKSSNAGFFFTDTSWSEKTLLHGLRAVNSDPDKFDHLQSFLRFGRLHWQPVLQQREDQSLFQIPHLKGSTARRRRS